MNVCYHPMIISVIVEHWGGKWIEYRCCVCGTGIDMEKITEVNDDKICCKNCRAGGYVLSLNKVSCSHTEEYNDPDYVCDLHRKIGNKGVIKK